MGVFDLPLEKLKHYEGSNPCPKDFDEFWERSLREMRATEPCMMLKKAAFQTEQAECFDMYFTGVKHARIHVKYCKPRNEKGRHPAVILFHGYTGDAGPWSSMMCYVANGFSVFSMDCRGQGGKSEDPGRACGTTMRGHFIRGLDGGPENMLMRDIFLDTAQLADLVMRFEEVDETRVGVHGQSQGGALTLVCASLEPRIKRLTPLFPFLSDYKRVWEMDLADDAYYELSYYFRWFDPCHERQEEIFERLGYIDVQNFVGRIRGEVLMGTGMMDMTCPPSTQFAVYNKIRAPKKHIIYPDFCHEDIPDFSDRSYQFLSRL